jgi:SAM-dependent methyltransferase
MGGRDYFYFKNLGCDTYALDLGPQPEIERIVYANVEEHVPFPDAFFDAVVMSEVIEHLVKDVQSLRDVRRVLKDNGRLLVSLPFYHDAELGHMRIYSPITAKRTFDVAGFRIDELVERPALIAPSFCNALQHTVSLLTYLITGHTAYPLLTNAIGSWSWNLGHIKALRLLRRHSGRYGGFYRLTKSNPLNYVDLNRSAYTQP